MSHPPFRSGSPRLAIAWLLLAAAPRAIQCDPVGSTFEISGTDCRFPDVAYASVSRKYLVAWADYSETRVHGRLVDGAGALEGPVLPISEEPYGALFPAIAYNAKNDEFLVTWDDFGGRGEVIHGQRVRASDGALRGKNFAIGSVGGGIRSAVAWSSATNAYLVVYFGPGTSVEVYGQRVSGAGQLLGTNFPVSRDAVFSGYPAVAWGASGNQFLVTWDNDDGNIHARRVDAATGTLLGSTIVVTQGGAKDRSCVAYDTLSHRWLVQYNDGAHPGQSYDQYGQLVSPDGTLIGGPIPIAGSPGFEGDTQFGGDIAFAPLPGRFFSSFGTDTGMAGQELLLSGMPASARVILGTGYYTSLNNAADTERNRFLTAWEGLVGRYRIYGRLCAATLAPPESFAAVADDGQVHLSWRNPGDRHFTGTLIRHGADRYPTLPTDGELLTTEPGDPSTSGFFTHAGLENWVPHYYAAFSMDSGPNYSRAALAIVTPRPRGVTIGESDFASGPGGWTLTTWRAGSMSPGTISWDPAAGNVLSTGSGITNNVDSCTREGSAMTRAFSTAGHTVIQVEYDVMASLHTPPEPSAGGSCEVLEGSIEDKLVVSYSLSGTGGPWSVGQILAEGIELPTLWSRRFLNLAGIEGADNNPRFALRFEWQFNHERDAGRVDNIRVLSGAVTGSVPEIRVSPSRIEPIVEEGEDPTTAFADVWNPGEGTLDFTVAERIPWLAVSPLSGSSAGPPRRLAIRFDASGLGPGSYDGAVQVQSTSAANSPQTIAVRLRVVPRVCLREPFDYYDGKLETMSGAIWNGAAEDQILVEDRALVIVGGSGAQAASRSFACPGSPSVIQARIKIRRGSGTGDFFWNIQIEDPALEPEKAALARWYGGSTIARGRVGATATADMILTGSDIWDDLLVKIDAPSGSSEFFFNGASYGTISHGGSSAGTSFTVRIERIDRATTEGDSICFDDLLVERSLRMAFHRGDPNSSGETDISDAIAVLNFLFLGGPTPMCAESADSNNDASIDISDGIHLLQFLFLGGAPPAAPGPQPSACGEDPDEPGSPGDIGCLSYEPCAAAR